MNDISEVVADIFMISLVLLLAIILIFSERRDMQDAKEDIGCVWVETGGDTMIRECK